MRLDSLNGGFLDNDRRLRLGDQADPDAERQGPAGTGGVTRREPTHHRAATARREPRDHRARRDRTAGFVTATHLSEDESTGPAEDAAQAQLGQHSIETVWALVDVFEKQN